MSGVVKKMPHPYDEAKLFFNLAVQKTILKGEVLTSTHIEHPIFVPVIITPANHELPPVKFAFLESKGEWYLPKIETPELHQPLKHEIKDVLLDYPETISLIYVAPYATPADGDISTTENRLGGLDKSDLGLVGAIKNYESIRTSSHIDNHLYLLSKWDLCYKPNTPDDKFSNPDQNDLLSILKIRYKQSWAAYLNMPTGKSRGRKNYMQYCAGLVHGNEFRRTDESTSFILNHYPRTLWNWLYNNATSNGESGLTLFHDVTQRSQPKRSIIDHIKTIMGISNK